MFEQLFVANVTKEMLMTITVWQLIARLELKKAFRSLSISEWGRSCDESQYIDSIFVLHLWKDPVAAS